MKKIILLLLAALLLAGCSQSDEPYIPTGDGLTWDDGPATAPTETEPMEQRLELVYAPEESMHPLISDSFTNRVLFSLMYQPLFAVDRSYEPTPILCSRYTVSQDMRKYTFYVEDAVFSDGAHLTIQDVYASYQVAMKGKYYKGRFTHVKEMYLSEDGGITFEMDTSFESLPLLLDIPIVQAAELVIDPETGNLVTDPETGLPVVPMPAGTGPYILEQALSGTRLRLRRDWWCESDDLIATTSSIRLTQGDTPAEIRDAFEFESVTLVCADPGSDNYADFRCDYELWDCENGYFVYLGCNVLSEVFSNTEVRSALTYALDRNALVDTFYQGFGRSATLAASPQSPFYNSSLASRYEYDPDRFAQVIRDQNMVGTTVRLLVNADDTMRLRVARQIKKMLEAGGLKVEMLESSHSRFMRHLNNRTFDLYLGQTKLSPNMDLTPFFRSGGSLRYGALPDAEIYAMCMEALANSGNFYNLHQMVANDGRLTAVLFHSYAVYAERGALTGLAPSRDNVFFYSIGKYMDEICTVE